ncbi:DUF2235 domain-containing protein [Dyella sp. M7H15-1]|uniref:T6SS phospholipase effector Tle1-like catalytic domain-containing protein n=1 Tax=Dyella sp. M7H15-1 TaxID=2501295 RepID=UPI001004D6CD|nr:DUF2235 domain-containing protein [Dyella sp. M7H15-1]QAU23576.1 DUF2235 domain-containing protein [Dyella sp. M7H15-1]
MSFTLTSPAPMPANGMRELTPKELALRASAMACIQQLESAQCQGQAFVSLFFDGTGNNKDWKEPALGGKQTQTDLGKHSNVARLYNVALDRSDDGFFSHYIPGVGTPFPDIGDGGGSLGMSTGYMGADRINWGITRVLNSAAVYLTGHDLFDKKMIRVEILIASSNSLGPAANRSFRPELKKLADVVARSQRKLTSINVAAFGFSRGAAQARVFVNWLAEMAKQNDGSLALAGVPLRFYFLGLFDTVASVGIPDAVPGFEGHMSWANGKLGIHPSVERCAHFIALHEQRASFPLELAERATQVTYPGVHSDVGGGYLPTEQGKLSQLSQIPLIDMHYEAMKSGVPLLDSNEIGRRDDLLKDFHCPKPLIEAYNAYLDTHGSSSVSGKDAVVDVIHQHTRQYLQWRGDLLESWQGLKTRDFYRRATSSDQKQLLMANTDLSNQMAVLDQRIHIEDGSALDKAAAISLYANTGKFDEMLQPVDASTRDMLATLRRHAPLPPAVVRVLDDYVHDSRAGFRPLSNAEPYSVTGGYLRYRTVFSQPSRNAALAASDAADVQATEPPTSSSAALA